MPEYSWTLTVPSASPGAGEGVVYSGEALADFPDFGFDSLVLPDLDITFTPRRDRVMLADAFARRIFTPRGALWADPNYGFDIRDFLNDEINTGTLAAIRGGIEGQVEQDERFLGASVRVAYDINDAKLLIEANLYSDVGPFSLVMSVSSVTAEIFVVQEA